jgi:hypothetical protein
VFRVLRVRGRVGDSTMLMGRLQKMVSYDSAAATAAAGLTPA